ncbi:BspA family leucine-rich repeat surface protein [Leuconostoc falkenbergense]|uniref:BspA family leucine-rich repeat surface protein n=1 Tax=Leuconostoc falkenbergense TaxID=2766470 RepID=UPI001FC7E385|nr:BspA family leucine-rich repeat surface protein [Leuconostoc falkenbergense]
MRVRKSLYIIIITLLMTLSGPLQAVTASQLSEKDNKQETTMRLPNEGRSDLQELIQRVDANVGGSSAEEPSSESAIDEPETVEAPVAEITDNQKPVVKTKAPRAITTNTNGTSTWTFDSGPGLLVFGTGKLSQRVDNNLTNAGVDPTTVVSIQFNSGVVAPSDVTYLFANLTQLSEFIDLNNFNTSSVTSMSYWFYQTSALSTPDLSMFVTSNVTNMSYMFERSGVTILDLSSWDVTKVTSFKYMFSETGGLSILDLTDWGVNRTASDVSMYGMFSEASIPNLRLTNFKTTNVTNMSYMFSSSDATSLDLSDWDVTKVEFFTDMFWQTQSLTTLDLTGWGVNRTASDVSMYGMFTLTSALTNLTLTNFKTTNVSNMSYMFSSSSVTSLDLSEWDVTKVQSFDEMFQTGSLTTLNLTNWGVNRTTSFVSMEGMFSYTSALTNLTLTNFKTTNVAYMSNMFCDSGVTSLDLSNWDVTNVARFNYMFAGAKLRTLNLFGWDTSSATSPKCFTILLVSGKSLWERTLSSRQVQVSQQRLPLEQQSRAQVIRQLQIVGRLLALGLIISQQGQWSQLRKCTLIELNQWLTCGHKEYSQPLPLIQHQRLHLVR